MLTTSIADTIVNTAERYLQKVPLLLRLISKYVATLFIFLLIIQRFAPRWFLLAALLGPLIVILLLFFIIRKNIASLLEGTPLFFQKLIHKAKNKKGAGWATIYDLQPLLYQPGSQRLYLGQAETMLGARHDVYLSNDNHLAITATIGQGKTTGYIIPMLFEADPKANIICVDIKGELFEITSGYREKIARRFGNHITVFDPDQIMRTSKGAPSPFAVPWDITAMCKDFQVALGVSDILVQGIQSSQSNSGGIWTSLAQQNLAVLLHLAAHSSLGMRMVVDSVNAKNGPYLEKLADIFKAKMNPMALKTLQGWLGMYQEGKDSVFITIQSAISAYLSDNVLEASKKAGSISFPDFVAGEGNTHYICVSSSKQSQYASVIVSHIDQAISAAIELAERTPGNALPNRLYVLIDEAGNLTKLPKLKNYLATLRSMNIRIITVWQNVSQIQALYGNDDANHIVDASGSRLFLGGSSDTATLELMQKLAGEKRERKISKTKSKGQAGSTSESDEYRPLLSAQEARQLPRGQGLLISSNIPPVRIHSIPWFNRPDQVAKSKISLPDIKQ
jgi:type IV secretory pathway TraG/TraD family ATPase VirD4